jgi:Protein of unknown function (DUF4012)
MDGDRQADGPPTDRSHDDGDVEVQRAAQAANDGDDELVEKWREILRRRREAEDELRRRRERDIISPPKRVPRGEPGKDDSPQPATESQKSDSGHDGSEKVIDVRNGFEDDQEDAIDSRLAEAPIEETAPPPVVRTSPRPAPPEPGNGRSPARNIVDVRPTPQRRRDTTADLHEVEHVRPADAAEAARQEKRKKQRTRLRWVIVAVAAAFVLLVVDLIYVGLGMYDSLQSAKANLERGREALEAGRYDEAQRSFSDALGDSQSAVGLRSHPAFWMAERTAWTRNDSRIVAALSDAALLASAAGARAVEAIDSVGQKSQGLAEALYNDGEIRVSAAEHAAPAINDVDVLLSDALELLEAAPNTTTGAVGEALETALVDVGRASQFVSRANTVVDALPSLFGGGSPRRYLLVFQALSETRGSGGVVEYYGELEASDGRLTLGSLHSSDELNGAFARIDQVPEWFANRYRPFNVLGTWERATFSPSFPAVATTLMAMYENATGRPVDGVVAVDAIMLGLLTDATGPIQHEGFDEVVTSENASRVLMYEIYKHFDGRPDARHEYVIGVMEKTWRIVTDGVSDVSKLTAAMSEAQSTQHLKVYSEIGDDQAALRELGLAANPTAEPGHVQMVFHNNLAGNNIDYFSKRETDTSIELHSDGSATVTSTAVIENRAPRDEDEISFLAGPAKDEPTVNRMNLTWLLPEGAQLRHINEGSLGGDFTEGVEATLPTVSGTLDIPPDGTTQVSVEYEIPQAVSFSSGGERFRFTLFPQTGPNADNFTLLITPPPGYRIEELVGNGVTTADGYGVAGTLDRPVTVELGLSAE